ncbi:MAG: co-chaperone GroES [Candidatus Komeilibacteria bacterium]|nr:co-chaperone GroES [Candidatus Komeilibacteria bacterium]
MKLKPLGDHIVVKAKAPEDVTKSGIVLPTSDKEKPEQGEVVAVGTGKLLENGNRSAMEVKVGDVIIFKGWPEKIKIEDQEYQFISQSDVVCILEK